MKTVLPGAWSSEVNEAGFDILLGRFDTTADPDSYAVVTCQGIMPTILAALQHCLGVVSARAHLSDDEAGELSLSLNLPLSIVVDEYAEPMDLSFLQKCPFSRGIRKRRLKLCSKG
jgi:hypothetical protein